MPDVLLPRARRLITRPDEFRLSRESYLARGLVFAGLGAQSGGSHYHDSSVYGRHGIINGFSSVAWENDPELKRPYIDFDGINGYINGMGHLGLPGINTFTISVWARISESAAISFLFSLDNDSEYLWAFWDENDVRSRLDAGSAYDVLNGPDPAGFAYDSWWHYAATYDPPTYAVYFNGVLHDSASASGPIAVPSTQEFLIASRDDLNNKWEGEISDVLVYHRALSIPEIEALANPADPLLDGLIEPAPVSSHFYITLPAEEEEADIPIIQHHRQQQRVVG